MNRVVAVAALLATAGCAAVQKPMSKEDGESLRGKRLAVVVVKAPDFTAMTAGKAMFGMFGAVAMISAGNELVAKNKVEDPALKMSADLAGVLAQRFGVTPAGAATVAESDEIEQLVAQHKDAELALTVKTTLWSFSYFPTDWSHYRVNYGVKAAVINLKTKQVLAEGTVKRVPDQLPNSPTYDELVGSEAARLKAELKKASDDCYRDLVQGSWKL